MGINTVVTDPASILDVSSNNAGLLIPRTTFGVIDNEIKAKGYTHPQSMLIFDTGLQRFLYVSGPKKWSYLSFFDILESNTGVFQFNSVKSSYTLSIGSATDVCNVELNGTTNISAKGSLAITAAVDVAGSVGVTGVVNATDVQGTGAFGGGLVPKGGIIMWSGDPSTLPTNWALCDGANVEGVQTPDLRGRFIVGYATAGEYNSVGRTGGASAKTLSESELPAHIHAVSILTNESGGHVHPFKTHKADNTNENIASGGASSPADNPGFYNTRSIDGTLKRVEMKDPAGRVWNANSWDSRAVPDHAHNVIGNTKPTGSGESFDIRPPYYVLAFIIRIK